MAYKAPRCEVLPLADHQVSLRIDGRERLRWHFGRQYPRPFFFPLLGPSGSPLTRMGHPGAPNHDHHRSIWFAHHKVLGIDFWSDGTEARIQQKQWLCYQDGDAEAAMAVLLGWYDGHDPAELLEQQLIAVVRPGDEGEMFLEIQTSFYPRSAMLEFGQTNFGFLAVRVAKSISAHFGGGELTSSTRQRGEANLFAKPARWMDYSGPVEVARVAERSAVVEGLTYFDHPDNPAFPAAWHVREDGWMGSAPCLNQALVTTPDQPLTLRYLLHIHRGDIEPERADRIADEFATRAGYRVFKASIKHQQFAIQRVH